MPVKGSTAIQIQFPKDTSEITVEFLVAKIEITLCLLGIDFLYNFDSFLNPRKNKPLCGKNGKRLQLSPSQRSDKNMFLIAAEDDG